MRAAARRCAITLQHQENPHDPRATTLLAAAGLALISSITQANPIQIIHIQAAPVFVPIAGAVSTGNAVFVQSKPAAQPVLTPVTTYEVVGHEVIGGEVVGHKVVGYEPKNPSMSTVATR